MTAPWRLATLFSWIVLIATPLSAGEQAGKRAEPKNPASCPGDETTLETGEPAQVILETMKQVRPSVLDGTLFENAKPIGRQREQAELNPLGVTVRCIRALDAQQQRTAEGNFKPEARPAANVRPVSVMPSNAKTVLSLREAGRQLDATAELLEAEQLYEQADQIRAMAQQFRIEARAANSTQTPQQAPAVAPEVGETNAEARATSDRRSEAAETE